MSREQAKQFLISIGVAEPTDEAVTSFLNSVNGEAQKYKADADKAKDLQKQLDELQNAQLSDIEKANKAVEEANKRIAELEAREALTNQRNNAVSKWGLSGEQANKVVKDDGTIDFDELGKIISDKEKAAATAKEQELANGSNIGGSGSGNEEKPKDVENVSGINFGGVPENSKSAQDYYK